MTSLARSMVSAGYSVEEVFLRNAALHLSEQNRLVLLFAT